MKKNIILLLIIFLCIIVYFFVTFNNIKVTQRQVQKFNAEFEQYKDKEAMGTDIATLINKAIDNNDKYNVEKKDDIYVNNENDSVRVFVKLKDDGQHFDMERISTVGMSEFVKNFGLQIFKCTKINYHNKTKKISEIYFDINI